MLGPHVEALTWVGLKEGRTTCLVPMCGGSNLGRVEGGKDDMLGPHVESTRSRHVETKNVVHGQHA